MQHGYIINHKFMEEIIIMNGEQQQKKVLLTLSDENIQKLDMIGSKYNIPRSTVLNLFLNKLTGTETINLN